MIPRPLSSATACASFSSYRVALRDVMLNRVEKGAKTFVKVLRPERAEVPAPSVSPQADG